MRVADDRAMRGAERSVHSGSAPFALVHVRGYRDDATRVGQHSRKLIFRSVAWGHDLDDGDG